MYSIDLNILFCCLSRNLWIIIHRSIFPILLSHYCQYYLHKTSLTSFKQIFLSFTTLFLIIYWFFWGVLFLEIEFFVFHARASLFEGNFNHFSYHYNRTENISISNTLFISLISMTFRENPYIFFVISNKW